MTNQEILDAGISLNIFVYDEDARGGDFTPRLVKLLRDLAIHHLTSPDLPDRILVPVSAVIPCDGGYTSVIGGNFWGIPVEALPQEIEDGFKRSEGGLLPARKHHLVALVTKCGKVIFGGY